MKPKMETGQPSHFGQIVPQSISFLGMDINKSPLPCVLDYITHLSHSSVHRFVVTPNVDHVVLLDGEQEASQVNLFRMAYRSAALRLCDSRIIAGLARLKGIILPVIPGSDLTALMMTQQFGAGTKVAIIGGTTASVDKIRELFPEPEFVQHIPPMGILDKPAGIAAICDFLAVQQPQYTLLAMGAPRSEIIADICARDGRFGGVSLCIGASIEFLTGEKKRAPKWVQQASLEWAHRLLSEPTRLWRRYLVEGPKIFLIFLKGGVDLRS